MKDVKRAQDLIGNEVYDREGGKIGRVGNVYVDDSTQQPEWVTVRTGMFGTKESFVPLSGASSKGENSINVGVTRDKVRDAPRVDAAQGHLSDSEGRDLYDYYGLQRGSQQDEAASERDTSESASSQGDETSSGEMSGTGSEQQVAGQHSAGMNTAGMGAAGMGTARMGSQSGQQSGSGQSSMSGQQSGSGQHSMSGQQSAGHMPSGTQSTSGQQTGSSTTAAAGSAMGAGTTQRSSSQGSSSQGSSQQGGGTQTMSNQSTSQSTNTESTAGQRTPTQRQSSSTSSSMETMTRSEERLRVTTENVESGRVKLRKYVTTEQENVTVPITREEVRIEREQIPEDQQRRMSSEAGGGQASLGESEQEIILHEEKPVVNKEAVPVERIKLNTEKVTEEQTVQGEVRRERFDIDDQSGKHRKQGE